ncbi:MAG: SDR family oxidoreductase [Rubrivivax sp.]
MTPAWQLFDLAGRVALVTGGSRGLGLQMAHALGDAGARIMLTSRKAADLEAAAAELSARGIDAQWLAADGGDAQQIEQCCARTLQRMGQVDILINNAGAAWNAPAEDHPLGAWDKVMNLNVRAAFLFAREVAKASMIPRRRGRIVNIASIAGLGGNRPGHGTIAYNTSKGAVLNFTRALAAEWGAHGITVNAIAPGTFPTRMIQGVIDQVGSEAMAARAPLGRLGDDDDMKGAVLLFASDAGKHITGQVLAIDGGVSIVTTG